MLFSLLFSPFILCFYFLMLSYINSYFSFYISVILSLCPVILFQRKCPGFRLLPGKWLEDCILKRSTSFSYEAHEISFERPSHIFCPGALHSTPAHDFHLLICIICHICTPPYPSICLTLTLMISDVSCMDQLFVIGLVSSDG